MNRIIVLKPVVGIYSMQVCAVSDATDREILSVCDAENPSGSARGWTQVDRSKGGAPGPVVCVDDPQRQHFLVDC